MGQRHGWWGQAWVLLCVACGSTAQPSSGNQPVAVFAPDAPGAGDGAMPGQGDPGPENGADSDRVLGRGACAAGSAGCTCRWAEPTRLDGPGIRPVTEIDPVPPPDIGGDWVTFRDPKLVAVAATGDALAAWPTIDWRAVAARFYDAAQDRWLPHHTLETPWPEQVLLSADGQTAMVASKGLWRGGPNREWTSIGVADPLLDAGAMGAIALRVRRESLSVEFEGDPFDGPAYVLDAQAWSWEGIPSPPEFSRVVPAEIFTAHAFEAPAVGADGALWAVLVERAVDFDTRVFLGGVVAETLVRWTPAETVHVATEVSVAHIIPPATAEGRGQLVGYDDGLGVWTVRGFSIAGVDDKAAPLLPRTGNELHVLTAPNGRAVALAGGPTPQLREYGDNSEWRDPQPGPPCNNVRRGTLHDSGLLAVVCDDGALVRVPGGDDWLQPAPMDPETGQVGLHAGGGMAVWIEPDPAGTQALYARSLLCTAD